MAITIYTYSNPYEINKEPYFASIQNCFQLCVSQTLVNGLCDQYKDYATELQNIQTCKEVIEEVKKNAD